MTSKKITKSQYEALKENYLSKNKTMFSLYVELNNEIEVSRHLFFQLINKIRQEEGLNHFYK
ncbi:MAG: hypothetical protein IJI96_00935 [Methanobrevibacter sp.]|nr:hypothetical protein [Methanobrevibacter sp.]MBQ6628888.1 hypothetical protein [Methanobrevibacter sp.]